MFSSSTIYFYFKKFIKVFFLIICLCNSNINFSQSFIPSDINSLKLWLRSDTGLTLSGNLVDQWNDISGNGNNVFQNTGWRKPTWQSADTLLFNYPVVKFDGASAMLETMFTQPDTYSTFIIYSHRQGSTGSFYSTGTSGHSLQRNTGIWPNSNAGNYGLGGDSLNLRNLYVDVYDFQNDTFRTFLNGIYRGGLNVPISKSGGTFYIGYAVNEPLNGDIAEFLIYDNTLPDSSRIKVENYLMNRYAPPVNLGPDIISNYFCDITLDAKKRFTSFLWSTGNTTQTIQVNQSNTYWVKVTDIFGRISSDTINISYPGNFSPFPDTTICYGSSIKWNTQLNKTGYNFLWQDGSADSVFTITQAGKYFVRVTDTLGCFYSDTINVQVDNFSQTASLGPDIAICSGANIALINGASQAVSYLWSTGVTSSAIAVTLPGNYFVNVQNVHGCIAKDSINVSIKSVQPNINFSVPPVCFGNVTQFSDLSFATLPDNIATWSWDFGNGATASVQNPSFTYSVSGTYTATLTVVTDSGCTNIIQKPVKINALPVASYNVSSFCSGGTIQFSDISTVPNDTIISWSWNFGDPPSGANNVSVLKNSSHFFQTGATYSVQLIVTSSSSCKDTIVKAINILQSPVALFTANSVCKGSTTTFVNSSSCIGTGTWSWNFGDGSFTSLKNPTHYYASTGTYTVILTATEYNGCKNKDTVLVNVNYLPIPGFTGDILCVNTPFQFLDTSKVTGSIINNWNWHFGTTGSSAQQNPTFTFSNIGIQTVSLSVTSEQGCTKSISKSVQVHALPVSSFNFSPQYGAPPLSVSFNNQSTGDTSWSWNFGDTSSINNISTLQNPIHIYQDTGHFWILLVAENQFGCNDSFVKDIYVAIPVLDIVVMNVATVSSSDNIQVYATLYNAGSVVINNMELFTYLNDGTPIRETWTGSLSPKTSLLYKFNSSFVVYDRQQFNVVCVEAKNPNGTNDDVPANNKNCTAIKDELILLDPFPNPATDDIYFLFILPENGDVAIKIFDNKGSEVAKIFDGRANKGLNKITFNTRDLKKGIYSLRLFYRSKFLLKTFIKE
ncbi:MAG: PKD domain-containing protein [Bacteroidota bacterium]